MASEEPKPRGKLFISYSRSDAALVERLRRALTGPRFGHEVWVDQDAIKGGDRWRSTIVQAIESSDIVLLCLSSVSITSEEVQKETALADARHKPILPILLERVQIPPALEYQLAGVQSVDLRDWKRGLEALREGLDKLLKELPKRQFLAAKAFVAKEERTVSPAERLLRDAVFKNFNEKLRQSPPDVRFMQQKMFSLNHLNDLKLTVVQLKSALTRTGYFKGAIDEEFTPELAQAVTRLQREHGLEADGFFGRLSYDVLFGLLERA